ncbi:MAG: potassium channel family protein [Spirochaetia bacterium]|nr:potassium channel family protein [Spirochaetia bacterium]
MIRFYFNLIKPVLFLTLLVVTGSQGYHMIEGWNLTDSVYMTIITITTVGFGEVYPLSDPGKWFTILLVISGVGFYGLAINVIVNNFLERNFKVIMEESKVKERLKNLRDHYIICGGGRMAFAMAEELSHNQVPFVIIENNMDAPVLKHQIEWIILKRDALLEETLVEAGIHRSKGLASVLPTDADNLFVVLSARSLNKELRIETRISHESSRNKMLQAGANKIISPYVIGGIQMARSFIEPDVDEFLDIMLDKSNYEFEMIVEHITVESEYRDKKIRDTNYRLNGFIIIGIKEPHGRFVFAPDPDLKLRTGFEVLLMGKAAEKASLK